MGWDGKPTADKKESPFDRKSCYDCAHLKGYVSWWCTNKDASKYRGTAIPGCIHCPFWNPNWNLIDNSFKAISKRQKPKPDVHKYPVLIGLVWFAVWVIFGIGILIFY